ncbi:MAG TPA: NHLP bacteriocin system secretion protein [Longimicrobiaceae bacterium]|jgi:HlyD family secretion protein|nr:NHLP bacteriocin system secretion protein [Longimicrobiaceae bacterium]
MQSTVFRKVSLDRLSSPEQLDQLVQVTTPRGWVALAALSLLIVTGVVWGVVGSVPEKVGGDGILVKSGGVFEVVPLGSGRVADVAVRVGEVVNEGQVVARIAQPDLMAAVSGARASLEDLRVQHRQLVEFGSREVQMQSQYLAQQRVNLTQAIHAGEEDLGWLREKIANQDRLVTQGLITRQTLLTTKQQYDAADKDVRANRNQLQQNLVDQTTLREKKQQEVLASQLKINEAEMGLRRQEEELRRSSEVVSPYTGRVLEVMTEQGHVINRGEPVLRMDLAGKTVKSLEAVIYVPSTQGKKIRPGMRIQISPSTVRQEEYGYVLGTVTYVSDFPATAQGMSRILKNDALVTALAGGGAPYEVHADLIPDPDTHSRYRWSSPGGPPTEIQSGTLCKAFITLVERRPIEMVLPILRSSAGV